MTSVVLTGGQCRPGKLSKSLVLIRHGDSEPVPQMPAYRRAEGEYSQETPRILPAAGSVAVPPPTAFIPGMVSHATTGDVPVCASA